ncbi:MAG: YitT family protein [Candidatus Phytoplasma vitis]
MNIQNMINYKKISDNVFYKWFFIILNDFLLAFAIYFFILGPKLNNGGLDGLSLLTVQIIKFVSCNKLLSEPHIFDLWIFIFVLFYNFVMILLSYKFFGKDFCQKTIFLAFFLTGCFFLLNYFIGIDSRKSFLSIIFIELNKNDFKTFMISSLLGGLLIGYTLSNIRNLGYNTGGMDVCQKILKDICGINFILVLLFTDGMIVLFSSLIEDKDELKIFFGRIFCSFLSLVIVGFVIEKRDVLEKNEKLL